jgi:membrane associated rhomboid family serine protease
LIPFQDQNPTRRFPVVTLTLIALNVVAFLLWEPITGSAEEQELFFYCHGAIPAEMVDLQPIPEVAVVCGGKSVIASIFSSMFLHGGIMHIVGNMLFLWVFGNNVEDRMGSPVFLGFYLLSGVAAAYSQVLPGPDSAIPLIGASGAVAGVLGAYIVMFPHARVRTLVIFYFITVIQLPALVVLGFWFLLQAFQGVGSLAGDVGGVAWFAHIGGFIFGALVALLFYRTRRPEPSPGGLYG